MLKEILFSENDFLMMSTFHVSFHVKVYYPKNKIYVTRNMLCVVEIRN